MKTASDARDALLTLLASVQAIESTMIREMPPSKNGARESAWREYQKVRQLVSDLRDAADSFMS